MRKVGKEFEEKYIIASVIDEKETYSLYEVEEIATGMTYIAKYYRLNLFWHALGSLKQQLEKMAADETEFVPGIHDIGEENEELYVVTHKIEGYKLSDLINRKEKFDVLWVLKVIKNIAEGIRYFSKNRIALYLINPNNIYIDVKDNAEEVSVKFVDMVSGDYVEEKDHDFMLEQAVYMAPEQLGITKKKFDIRSDLYSLGVVAYQLLVGRLPFRAKNLNQYMYLQIAQVPSAVSQYNSDVKGSLDQMIQCLLEKDPDNRYQSVESLLYDIREYLSGNLNFECNTFDSISKILFREKDFLPGRELDSLEMLLKKAKGFVVISGEKNTGKRVVLDLVKVAIKNQKNTTLYANGKYGSFGMEILWDLLIEYAKVFEAYPLRRQDILRREVGQRTEISKEFICQKDSMFEIFFEEGSNSEPFNQSSEETQLLKLWEAIGIVEEHLVVLLEGLNADEQGVKLLERFYACFEIMFLCISCNQTWIHSVTPDLEFNLKKLDEQSILNALDKVTAHRLEDSAELAKYVFQRSRGNIYLTTEVANWLFSKDALTYREGRWRTNPLVLFDLGLPSEIAQEIIDRSDELSGTETKVLYLLATVDGQLAWTYIKKVAELEGIQTDEMIANLKKMQFVEEKIKDTLYITFSDPLIYEHFRKQLSKSDIRYYSQKIAEVLEAEYARFHKGEEAILMNHYYLQAGNNEKVKQYSFEVALFLKSQGKNMQAIEVINGFLNALEYQDDEIILFYNAQKMAGEIYIAEGKPNEAEKTFEQLLQLDLTSEMRADILEERSWVSFYKGNFQEALNFVKASLKEKKLYLPNNDLQLYWGILYQTILRIGQSLLTQKVKLNPLKNTRKLKDETNQNIWWVSLLVDVRYFTYFSLWTTNRNWYKYRKSQKLAISYFSLGQVLMATPFRKMADKYLSDAVQITEEIGDDHMRIISYTILAYRCEVIGDYEGQLNYALMAMQLHKKIRFSPFYGMTMNALIHAYSYLGDFSNMLRYIEFYLKRAEDMSDNYGVISANIYYLQYYRGLANFATAVEYGEKALSLAIKSEDYFDMFCSYAELGVTYYFYNQDEQAIHCFEKALKIKGEHHFPMHYTLLAYSYYAMTLCRKQRKIQHSFPEDISLYSQIKKLLKVALREKKYPTYYGVALRAKAEWNVLNNNHAKAKKYYKESIEYTIKHKRQWATASTQLAYGQYLREQGEASAAIQEFILAEHNFRNLKIETYALLAQREMEALSAGTMGSDSEFNKFQRRLQKERKNMFFTDLIRDLSSVLDYRELIQKMIMVLLEASGAQQVVFMIPDESKQYLTVEEYYTNENLKLKNKDEMMKEIPLNLVKTVQQTKEVLVLENAEKSDYIKMDDMLVAKHIKSMMILPVCYKNSLQAVCYLENSLSTGIFTPEVVENMKVIANQMAVSMENAKLYKIAITDDLTGLYTRKHFDYLFEEELKIAKESGNGVGVVFIDIDKFKSINDVYGHMVGDTVLIEFAKFLKGNCRVTDVIGRFGGEEVILLLRGTGATESYNFAERLRKKLETYPIETDNGNLMITASFGVSSYPEHGDSMAELINKADTALYRSKNEGRNRVTKAK